MTFREFVDSQNELATVKSAIMNSLGATNDALDDPLANFKSYKKLLDNERNPQFAKLINSANNKAAIVKAVENAAVTKISIADLISLFRAGMSGDLPGGRKAPSEPKQNQDNGKQGQSLPQPPQQQQQQQPNSPSPQKGMGQGKIPGIG